MAVDAMGGDSAPRAVVEGAVMAARELGAEPALVGRAERIAAELRRIRRAQRLEIVDAAEVVEMHEHPAMALRTSWCATVSWGRGMWCSSWVRVW